MQQEEFAKLAFERTATPVLWTDSAGRLVAVNAAACRGLGYNEQALLAVSLPELDARQPAGDWSALMQRLRDAGHLRVETCLRRKDKSEFTVDLQLSHVRTEQGEFVCAFAMETGGSHATDDTQDDSARMYRSVIDSLPDGYLVADRDGRILEVNDTYCASSGYSAAELLGTRITALDATEPADRVLEKLDRIAREGSARFESLHRCKQGGTWPVEISGSYSEIQGGRHFLFVRDTRDRKLVEQLAEVRQQLSEVVYEGDMDALMRMALDAAETMTESTIGFFHFVERDQLNLSLQVWSTRTLREMCFLEGQGLHYPVEEAGVWVDCIRQRRPVVHNDYPALPHKKGMPDGHPMLSRELTMPVFREGLIVAVMGIGNKATDYTQRDIDIVERIADMAYDFVERKRAEQHIEYMAYYDTLTGLPNRVLLADRLNQAIAHHRRSQRLLAVCYLDLDGFKQVNDRLGHDAGDALLVQLSQRLTYLMREDDTLARLSGDEFLVLLSDLDSDRSAEAIVTRILAAIDRPFDIDEHTVKVSGSIGVTLFPTDDASADTLIRHADQAMYQAKNAGSGLFRLYDAVEDRKVRARRENLTEFATSLHDDQLVLHYQPRIELRTGRVVGVEALVRWQHPQRGLVMPGSFLPDLEGEPQEIALGEWVLRSALEQFSRWQDAGIHLPVSVNISPKHLQSARFVPFLRDLLAGYPEQTARQIELEVLETSAIDDTAEVAETMRAVAELGVRFSLDDFGTGYSSLTYFHRLPIDILKIDQNFVRDMIDDPGDMDIVEGVLRLSEALRRPVVAEGVETIELGFLLLYLGCRYAQGYGISRPMPAAELEAWLESWSQDNIWQQLGRETDTSDADFDLRMAIFSQRRWLEQVTQCIESDGREKPPVLDENGCQFSRWYRGIGRARYGDQPLYLFIPPKHTRLHQLAHELIDDAAEGRLGDPVTGLRQLYELSDELVAMLHRLQKA